MKSLIEAQPNRIYQVHSVTASDDTKRHLQTLGVTPGNRIALLQLQKENGIVLLQKSRVALDKSILENITIEEVKEKGEWVPLAQLSPGESAHVISIHGEGAIRRCLIDMGVTKSVEIYVRKMAPLGDPIEITLRGYELSLRKAEAELILVEKEPA